VRGDVLERICTSTQEGETAGCRLRTDRDRGRPRWAGSRPATWRLPPRRRQPTEGCNATGVWGTRGGGGPANQRHVRAHVDMWGGGGDGGADAAAPLCPPNGGGPTPPPPRAGRRRGQCLAVRGGERHRVARAVPGIAARHEAGGRQTREGGKWGAQSERL